MRSAAMPGGGAEVFVLRLAKAFQFSLVKTTTGTVTEVALNSVARLALILQYACSGGGLTGIGLLHCFEIIAFPDRVLPVTGEYMEHQNLAATRTSRSGRA